MIHRMRSEKHPPKAWSFFLPAMFFLAVASPAPASADLPETWRDGPYNLFRWISNPEDIALPRNISVHQFSSSHPDPDLPDYNRYLGEEGRRKKLLAEMEGPGAITRMWFTGSGAIADCILAIEIDGATPVESSIGGLVSGGAFPFVSPLVGRGSGGGLFCYLPIPYKDRCRVWLEITDSLAHAHYYQIQYASFPTEEGVNSFRLPLFHEDASSVARAIDQWSHPPERSALAPAEIESTSQDRVLFRHPGSGVIHQWEIAYDENREEDLPYAYLRVWDSEDLLIDCPLGALFGRFERTADFTNRFLHTEPGRLRFFWPIVHYGPIRVELARRAGLALSASFEHEVLAPEQARQRGRLRVEHNLRFIF
ncbi:MAG: hypothetical protein KC940_25420, partial [Candidatus Omnitrophica bacterium]|nr:hypothetical protein [Candidatus Omnitrophota bacterium]